MNGLVLVRYSPSNGSSSLTEQLAGCYRDVFADGPWHEWLRCPKCQRYWGVKDREFLDSQNFRHCNVPLVDFWPMEKVIADLYHEITPEASCWLAMDGEAVVGFCWGYPISLSELEEKIGVSLNISLDNGSSKKIAYQDEVGVLATYRGRKIAKAMVARRLDDFIEKGLQIGIVRTRQYPEPSETFSWYTKKLGYEIIVNYPEDDGRVILARQLAGLKQLLS